MISIIIPCFNDADVLPRAVASALNQTYVDKEVIVVDDGSDDPIPHYQGTRLIRHRHNRGLSAALNTGIERSDGDRFVILAADDELRPKHLELTSKINEDVVCVNFLAGGKLIRTKAPKSVRELMQYNSHTYAALVKKWVWTATGGFKEAMNPSWEDWEFWLNSAKIGATWGHVNAPLHVYNRNPSGRDAEAQGKDALLWGKLSGYHQDLFGLGKGVVTFVVPCYNHEDFVAEAVQSALDQIYPHTNVVVVDDGSPGNVAEALQDVYTDRVTLVRQENRHLSGARNTGIRYALQNFGSEYLVMLDADDQVDPNYVEVTLGAYQDQEYIYTDTKFIGDAFHSLAMEEYDCEKLAKQHLHPCTFLQPSRMWQDIVANRGFGYDENMKQGYEDWEYAVAGVEAEWCGRRVQGEYFFYRYHQDGSMRTEAKAVSSKLVSYIRSRHTWLNNKEQVRDMCKTCGGRGRFTASRILGGMGSVHISGVGEVNPTDLLAVEYTGSTTSTITKQGAGGQIYKYSGDPNKQARGYGPRFTIYARDAHLFVGPFNIAKIKKDPTPQQVDQDHKVEVVRVDVRPEPKPEVVEVLPKKKPLEAVPVEHALKLTAAGTEYEPDDFTKIKGIGPVGAENLIEAGFTMYDDLADANLGEISAVLKVNKSRAKFIQDAADKLAEELAE